MTETHADSPIVQTVAPGYQFEGPALELGGLMIDATTLTDTHIRIPLGMLNRHGLVAGATGTGKTKTLQLMAEQLSAAGVPVFAADIKGDLSGLATHDLKHYDFNWMNELRKQDESAYNMDLIAMYRKDTINVKADILNLASFDRGEAINMIRFYKQMLVSTRTLAMKDYMTANNRLLQELRKEYKIN